ncbi:MAG: DUF4388 domain-containing protein [Calditerrivibrio sp.]|nr:DUF4388 domain-containing protein [Calditerrivibrio sp.]
MAGRGLVGDLRAMPLPEVFQWIAFSNKNGELHLQRENEEVNLIFKNGKIVYVTSNIPKLLLGQILLRHKMLSKNDLVRALSLQKQLKVPIGQVLIEHGILSEKNVKKVLEIQVEEVVYLLIGWENGFFMFDEKDVRSTMISLSVDMLILEGLRRKDDMDRFLKIFNEKSILVLKNPEHPLCDVINGQRTVGEIVNIVEGDAFETYEKIYSGIVNGDIKVSGEGDFTEENDPIIKFIIGLELFNKNKIYESFKTVSSIINSGFKNEQIKKFYDNMVLHITKYFYKKFGGENTVFTINRLKLLDEKIYIAPVEGFVLSRFEEYPSPSKLLKVLSLSKTELFLIIDKLYKLGLLLIKQSEKSKTEVMENNILNTLLNIYKRELTGELEIVCNTLTLKVFFENGHLKFIYSTTPEFSLVKYLHEQDGFIIDSGGDNGEINVFLMNFMEKNNYSVDDLRPIIEIYENMLFNELLHSEIISTIFIFDNRFPINFDFKFNILFMLFLGIVNNKLKVKNEINKNSCYELTRDKSSILEDVDNIGLVNNLLEQFENGVLDRVKIPELSSYEMLALNILYKTGFVREVEHVELSLEELTDFLNQIKSKTPHEIFEVDHKGYDIEMLKQKYLRLSKVYHPDLITDPKSRQVAREIFEIIKYAYDSLVQNNPSETKKKIDIRNILLSEQLLTSGKVYMNMGRINDAVESFIKAYNAFSNDDEIMVYYGYAMIRKGAYEDGVKIIDMVGLDKYNDPELYAVMIEGYLKLEKRNEAKKYLEKAIMKFPDKAKRFNMFASKLK